MNEGQLGSVKSLPRRAAGVFVRRLSDRMRVEPFTAQWMTDFRKVDANLMRAAGFEAAFDNSVLGKLFHWPQMCNGSLSAFCLFAQRCAATQSVAAVADEPGLDRLSLHAAVHDRDVSPLDFVPGKHMD